MSIRGSKLIDTIGTVLAALLPVAVCAATYKVDIDRSDGLYRCGETATFTVRVLSTNALAEAANPCAMLDNFGSSVLTNMPFDVTATGVALTVSGTLGEPGFLRLSLPPTKSGRDDPYVFSVGFEPEKIRKGSPSPDDFDAFWAAARARLASEVPIDAQMTRVPERSTSAFDFYRISFATFGRRVHGYMSVPTDKSKAPFPVDFGVNAAGFGDWTNDMQGERDSIRVQFSVYPFEPDWRWRALGLESKYKAMDAEVQAKYGAPRYCQAGITESREAYFFYPVILGIDRAVDWIASRPDVDKSRFRYQGTSQGGGFGFYLCGLNRAFTRAAFYVPAITDTMGYLAGRQSGWPQIVENNSSTPERRAAAEKWAPYFDGANFASRIKCPVRVAVGFSDITCPPCAVYAAYNEIKVADKAIGNGIGMTHSCSGRFYSEFGAWTKGTVENEDKAYGELHSCIAERIRLWPGLAPHETESNPGRFGYDEKIKGWRRREVSQPELVMLRPSGKPRDTMVVVMPGGGYNSQHMGHFCRDSKLMASVLLYTELHKRKIPAQLFVYANVSHGLGDTVNAKGWQNRIADWMESIGF